MEQKSVLLNKIIQEFLNGKLSAISFEKEYTEIFDFSDLSDASNFNYFQSIRTLLEHYTSEKGDLKKYPQYYIGDEKLKEGIIKLSATQ